MMDSSRAARLSASASSITAAMNIESQLDAIPDVRPLWYQLIASLRPSKIERTSWAIVGHLLQV
jgi:hypothetical protein